MISDALTGGMLASFLLATMAVLMLFKKVVEFVEAAVVRKFKLELTNTLPAVKL